MYKCLCRRRRRITSTYAIKLNFIDRLQFVFDCLFFLLDVFISLLCINHKSMNVTAGYTSGSSNVCVWVGGMFTQMGKDRFLFSSSLSFTHLRTMGRRRRLLLAWRATLLKYLVLPHRNRVSKCRRMSEEKRIGRHSHDEQLSSSERATADLLCMAMIVVSSERRIYSNFTGELYIHIRSGTRPLTYARRKCRVERTSTGIQFFTLERNEANIWRWRKTAMMMMEYEQVQENEHLSSQLPV